MRMSFDEVSINPPSPPQQAAFGLNQPGKIRPLVRPHDHLPAIARARGVGLDLRTLLP